MSFSYWSYWFLHHPELKNLHCWFCLWRWLELRCISKCWNFWYRQAFPYLEHCRSNIDPKLWCILDKFQRLDIRLAILSKVYNRKCDKPSSILNWLQLGNIYHFLPFNFWIKRFHPYLVWLRKDIRWQLCILHKLVKRWSNLLPATRRFSTCFKLPWSWSTFIPF